MWLAHAGGRVSSWTMTDRPPRADDPADEQGQTGAPVPVEHEDPDIAWGGRSRRPAPGVTDFLPPARRSPANRT